MHEPAAAPSTPPRFRGAQGIRGLLLAAIVAAAPVVVAACGSEPGPTVAATSTASIPTATTGAATESPPDVTPDPNLPPQADTGWGTIWTALPPSFPEFPDAQTADPATGPVSGAFTVANSAADAKAVADFYLAGLDALGYGTGVDGPLEDGSYAVWASNGFGCDAQVTILPRGDESLVTALYGAGCPFV
jgi:hypothetical protein